MKPHRRHRCRPILLAVALLALLCTAPACEVHEHRIGNGPTGIGEESTRQFYILFGLVRFNEVNPQRIAGDYVGYQIRTEFSFIDLLLFPLLLPLTTTSRTVTVSW